MLLTEGNYSSGNYRFGFNGKEMDNEVKGTGNSYDFGARIYDPRVGRWWSVDPLASEYVPVSVYAFAIGNPIIFFDEDGQVVIGLDGKPVTYTKNKNGSITWSSNASADVKKIGNAMLTTTSGEKCFKAMQEMPTRVHLKFGRGGRFLGQTETDGQRDVYGFYEEATITINERAIRKDKHNDFYNVEEGIMTVGVHESWHLDPKQIDEEGSEINYITHYWAVEKWPMTAEYHARKEYRDKYLNLEMTFADGTKLTINLDLGFWEKMYEYKALPDKPSYTGELPERSDPSDLDKQLNESVKGKLIMGSEGY